jgi:hypothetical protein
MPRRKTMRKTGAPQCNDCGARIVFVTMAATGRRVPCDPLPVADGNVCARLVGNNLHGYVISAEHPANPQYRRYAAHFATCDGREPSDKPRPAQHPTLFD